MLNYNIKSWDKEKKIAGQNLTFEELIGLYNLLQRAKIFPAIFLFYLCRESKIKEIEKLSHPLFFFTRGVIIQDKEKIKFYFIWIFKRNRRKKF